MSNFAFLVHEFSILKPESLKAESHVMQDPEVSAIYARKALENSVKFIYRVDEELDTRLIKSLDLFGLIKESGFRDVIPSEFIDEMHFVRKLGNNVVHGNANTSEKNSLYANQCLYKLQRWIVEVYSSYEVEGEYDVLKLVQEPQVQQENKEEASRHTHEQHKLEEENAKLQAELENLKSQIPNKQQHVVKVKNISEKETRARLIDMELYEAGYDIEAFEYGKDVEYKLTLEDGSTGYADYVIWADDDKPLAVIEAKKSSVSVTAGKHQAKRYTEALKKEFGS